MDAGLWFVSLYNDGDTPRTLSFTATPHGQSLIVYMFIFIHHRSGRKSDNNR